MKITQQRNHEDFHIHPMASVEWVPDNVPQMLRLMPQWKLCYALGSIINGVEVTTPKRPMYGPKAPFISFDEVLKTIETEPTRHFGYCVTPEDDYVVIDVDDLPQNFTLTDLPQTIQDLLGSFKTYSEISPSGQGLHIIYLVDKATLLHRKPADTGVKGFTGSVFIYDQFITMTGHTFTSYPVARVPQTLFESIIFLEASKIQQLPGTSKIMPSRDIPSKDSLVKWLYSVPPTLSGHPLEQRYLNIYRTFTPPVDSPSSYDHWCTVIRAVHEGFALHGAISEGEQHIVEWSLRDEYGEAASENEIRQKYHQNPPEYDQHGFAIGVTHKTLISLASASTPEWERPLIKKGEVTRHPDCSHMRNWSIALEHLGVALHENEIDKTLEFRGNQIVLDEGMMHRVKPTISSKDELQAIMTQFKGSYYFQQASFAQINAAARHIALYPRRFNPFKEWVLSAPPSDPSKGSYFQALWETLTIKPSEDTPEKHALFRAMVKKNLMGLIRANFYEGPFSASTGIVVLQGPEASYKSTWIRSLLPDQFHQYVFSSQIDPRKLTIKEWQLEAAQCMIWLKDEVETVLEEKAAVIKSMLDQQDDTYRPLYSNTVALTPRRCIFWGTTNSKEIRIPDTGSRRIMIVPVVSCNTSALVKLDRVKIFRELYDEFLTTPDAQKPDLWRFTLAERQLNEQINRRERRTETDLDILLNELFVWEHEFSLDDYCGKQGAIARDKLCKMKDIVTYVENNIGKKSTPGTKQIKHAIERQFINWAGFESKTVGTAQVDCGHVKWLKTNGLVSADGWMLPPRRSVFEAERMENEVTID